VRTVCAVQCASHPCQNSGMCTDSNNNPGIEADEFKCTCINNMRGPTCGAQSDPCENHPCHNGGTCIVVDDQPISTFSCLCTGGFEGITCDTAAPTRCLDFDDIPHATLVVRSALSSRLCPLSLCSWPPPGLPPAHLSLSSPVLARSSSLPLSLFCPICPLLATSFPVAAGS
jgi:hypothetical protein